MNYLKSKLILLIAACFAAAISCSPKIVDIISSQKAKVNVDGQVNEYERMRYYSGITKMLYSLSNDSLNLYLCLKVNDEAVQRQILMAGMNIWLDTLSKSKEQIGIRYPLGGNHPTVRPFKGSGEPKEKPDLSQMKKDLLKSQNTMELRGFKDITNGPTLLQTPDGIRLQIDWDNKNSMVYELAIPLKNWYKPILTKSDTVKIFTLKVSVNAIEMPSISSGGFDGSPPGGTRGGPPSGSGMGGPPSGIPPAMEGLTEKKTFTMKFKLHIDFSSQK